MTHGAVEVEAIGADLIVVVLAFPGGLLPLRLPATDSARCADWMIT